MADEELDRQLNRNPVENLEEDADRLSKAYESSNSEEDKKRLITGMYQLAVLYQEIGEDGKAQEVYDRLEKLDEKRVVSFMRKMTPK
jgi:hypothetical protein